MNSAPAHEGPSHGAQGHLDSHATSLEGLDGSEDTPPKSWVPWDGKKSAWLVGTETWPDGPDLELPGWKAVEAATFAECTMEPMSVSH